MIPGGFKCLDDDISFDVFQRTQSGEHRCSSRRGANVFGKIFGRQVGIFSEYESAFESVAKFADVAGPGVCGKHAARSVREFRAGTIVNCYERNEQMFRERENVCTSLAKRRNGERKNVETKKKIFAELSGGDGGLKIHIGEGDEAGFDTKRLRAAETLESALLKDAQQFCLRVGREGRDFVKDDGAGTAKLEAAEFAFDGSGEGAAFVAKKLAFNEGGRKGSAIDFEKRRVAPRAEFMNEARKMIFAGAGFSGDEESRRSRGDLFRKFEQAVRNRVGGNPREPVGHGLIVASRRWSWIRLVPQVCGKGYSTVAWDDVRCSLSS